MKELQVIDPRRTSIVPAEPILIQKPDKPASNLKWYRRTVVAQAVIIAALCVWNYILQAGPI